MFRNLKQMREERKKKKKNTVTVDNEFTKITNTQTKIIEISFLNLKKK